MVWGVPSEVKGFFRPVRGCSRPIRNALAAMVLALTLAPHRRCLKTVAGSVLGHRCHVATISRRLTNPKWKTRDRYTTLYDGFLEETNRWERRQARGRRREWIVAIDTTYHATMSEKMENLIVMSKREDPRRQTTRQHAFIMGLLLTDRGGRIPLPRKSYYTEEYCRKHRRKFRTTVQLAADMVKGLRVPDDVDVVVVFDSALDAEVVHRACRQRGFCAVFPIDPNRVLGRSAEQDAAFVTGEKVVAWTRSGSRILPGQSAEWWAYHYAPVSVPQGRRPQGRRAGTARCSPAPTRCSSDGCLARIKVPSVTRIGITTSTNSHSDSIAAPRPHGASCSTASCGKPCKSIRLPTRTSSEESPTTTCSGRWSQLDNPND